MLKFNHKLLYAEETLVRIKKALRHTPLWTALYLKHSEDYTPSTMLGSLALKIEGLPGYNNFLDKFWAKTRGFKGSSAYVSVADAPEYLMLKTENRLALLKYAHLLAQALDGQKITLSPVSIVWRWDITRKQLDGRPRHYQSYELDLNFDSDVPFHAQTWLDNALVHVCPSLDSRADDYPFEAIEATLGFSKCKSMEKTTTGLVLGFDNLEDARLAVQALYPDCAPQYWRRDGAVYVRLVYPDLQEILKPA